MLGWVYSLIMDPGRPQGFLELSQANNVDVDELHNFIALGGATGLVTHDFLHDPGERRILKQVTKQTKHDHL